MSRAPVIKLSASAAELDLGCRTGAWRARPQPTREGIGEESRINLAQPTVCGFVCKSSAPVMPAAHPRALCWTGISCHEPLRVLFSFRAAARLAEGSEAISAGRLGSIRSRPPAARCCRPNIYPNNWLD